MFLTLLVPVLNPHSLVPLHIDDSDLSVLFLSPLLQIENGRSCTFLLELLHKFTKNIIYTYIPPSYYDLNIILVYISCAFYKNPFNTFMI